MRVLAALCILAFIVTFANAQVSSRRTPPNQRDQIISHDDYELYRNFEHKFRIRFPKGWQIKDADSLNIVKKASDPISRTILMIIVKPVQGRPSETDMKQMMDGAIESMKSVDPAAEVLEKGIRYISMEKAVYLKGRLILKALNLSRESIMIMYSLVHQGKLYVLQAIAPSNNFPSIESALNASFISFIFEEV
ncbi:MAG TPA: hypothetical protein VFQ47_06150 [Nitrososphaera sp.]|jgi:hypothetical protein|nr:hypothetical protein [Nitrososphaera sp.]